MSTQVRTGSRKARTAIAIILAPIFYLIALVYIPTVLGIIVTIGLLYTIFRIVQGKRQNQRVSIWRYISLPVAAFLALFAFVASTIEPAPELTAAADLTQSEFPADGTAGGGFGGGFGSGTEGYNPLPMEPSNESDESDLIANLAPDMLALAESQGLTPALVTRVIDGDTIEVQLAGELERVRFIGIDTPEVGEPGAEEATLYTSTAIAEHDNIVWLGASGQNRDRYGRLRRLVWLSVPTGDIEDEYVRAESLLNARLVAAGYATDDTLSQPAASEANQSVTNTPTPNPTPTVEPTPTPVATRAPFRNCTEVWEVLGRPIRRGEPGFHTRLDRDNDGVGCETRPR